MGGEPFSRPSTMERPLAREPAAAGYRCSSWSLATATCMALAALARRPTGCGAFALSPAHTRRASPCGDRRGSHHRLRRFRSSEGATEAGQSDRGVVGEEEEKEGKELRLLTWMEVEAQIKRVKSKVQSCSLQRLNVHQRLFRARARLSSLLGLTPLWWVNTLNSFGGEMSVFIALSPPAVKKRSQIMRKHDKIIFSHHFAAFLYPDSCVACLSRQVRQPF